MTAGTGTCHMIGYQGNADDSDKISWQGRVGEEVRTFGHVLYSKKIRS